MVRYLYLQWSLHWFECPWLTVTASINSFNRLTFVLITNGEYISHVSVSFPSSFSTAYMPVWKEHFSGWPRKKTTKIVEQKLIITDAVLCFYELKKKDRTQIIKNFISQFCFLQILYFICYVKFIKDIFMHELTKKLVPFVLTSFFNGITTRNERGHKVTEWQWSMTWKLETPGSNNLPVDLEKPR